MRTLKSSLLMRHGLALALLAGALGGCGYTTEPLYPKDVKTVAVPMWHRGADVYRRGLEMQLTEAIVKYIQLETPYNVVSREKADTELAGTIDRVEQRVLTYDPDTGQPRELEITLFVSFEWKDLRKGTSRVKRSNYSSAVAYVAHEPFNRDFFQGSEDAINKLARRIVEEIQVPF